MKGGLFLIYRVFNISLSSIVRPLLAKKRYLNKEFGFPILKGLYNSSVVSDKLSKLVYKA